MAQYSPHAHRPKIAYLAFVEAMNTKQKRSLIIDELETTEARYDAMPPEVARQMSRTCGDPLTSRHHSLKTEVAFARRMFRVNRRACKSQRRQEMTTRRQYREDCRHWWHRYRKAQASAAEIRGLLALRSLSRSIID